VLAGGIAHDFNNLLGGIYGNIEMVRNVSKDSQVAGYLDTTLGTLNRARNLTQQLLTFAKGGLPIRKTSSLFPFVRETVQFALSGSNISSTYDIPVDLWYCDFDSNQIGQVIDNLTINALQAMPLGGTIRVKASNVVLTKGEHPSLGEGRYVRISIADDGIGIPREIQSRIFDPFFTTKQKGSGLGLATAYSIMYRHEGSIDVESDSGKGSTFNIFLPASNDQPKNETAPPSQSPKGSGRILVMDDEEVLLRTISVLIRSIGYTVVGAKDGSEAIRILKEENEAGRSFIAIILDLTVPGGMGGKEAITEIRILDPHVPVLVSSGYADDPIMARPKDYGFTASISKPFSLTELSQALQAMLGQPG
jgi:CheY-like chemotaxis protein